MRKPAAAARPAATRPATAAEGQAGFTLVELTIATALLLLTLILSLSLIEANRRQMTSVDASVEEAVVEAGVERLRRDLRSAQRAPLFLPTWIDAPLVLDLGNGTEVVYTRDDRGLVRRQTSERGRPDEEVVVLQRITDFRWRMPAAHVVDIELTWPRHEDATAFGLAPVDRERWRVALRNRQRTWW